ncbi:hypothetical protein VdG1_02580 [Verticillium dahliae VDG1]|nr:hypothetical protein VdG1_02580 [Verticillium dahliae VDG1]
MDHGAMTMASTVTSMLMPTATGMDMPAGTDAAATSGHDEMDMSAMMGGCKISMLWNWQTIDSCFISESWHVTSTGMFAGSCIGVAVRALLHLLQFAVAYFVMLLAMYYNGYIIICIFIGAYLGSFIFHWEKIGGSTGPTSAGESSTVCCG